MEIWSHTNARDDLVDDDFGPGAAAVGQIDVEADPDGEKNHAKPDGGQVLATFLDENASSGGHEGEGEDEREGVDSGEDGRGEVDRLEIEG